MKLARTHHLHPHFRELIRELDAEFWVRYPDEQQNFEPFNTVDDQARVLIAYEGDQPIGCGCFRPMKDDITAIEIKRMYVRDAFRSKGIGKSILAELESWAVAEGFKHSLLETGVRQPEAVAAYEKSGYTRIPNYGPYVGVALSICMRKELV